MLVKFLENSNIVFTKRFISESNALKFIELLENNIKPGISIETDLYINQFIPMKFVSNLAKENLLLKNLTEGLKTGLTTELLNENGLPSRLFKLNEEMVVQTSLDTAVRDSMFELFSRIVCARDYAHLLHLNADSGGEHLMLEKIYEILDDMVDDLGEKYFMARNIKIPNPLTKNEEYGTGDLGDLLVKLSDLVNNMCSDYDMDESMKSLVSGFGEDFQRCMGFYRQAQMDSPNKSDK